MFCSRGSRLHQIARSLTRGFFCDKAILALQRLKEDESLLTPLERDVLRRVKKAFINEKDRKDLSDIASKLLDEACSEVELQKLVQFYEVEGRKLMEKTDQLLFS